MKFDIDYVEKIVKIFSENNLTELTLEDTDKAIVLRKEKEVIAQAITPQAIATPAQFAASTVTSQVVSTEKKAEAKGKPVLSPMVGTFYKAPSPESKPFVSVGENIAVGQVVCIIEAMKLMNEIEAEISGKIIEICAQDGETVEYGQVLMYVE